MATTPWQLSEDRRKQYRNRQETIATELLEKYPEVTFDRHKFGIDVIHYVVRWSDAIRVEKRKRSLNSTVPSLDSYYLTEQAAKEAIAKHLPAARQKFEQCLKALNELKQAMGFDVSYSVEGDTHGIEDYPYISFEMEGFDFTYSIER